MWSSRDTPFNLESFTSSLLLVVTTSSLIAVTWYLRISWASQKRETGKRTKKLTWRIREIPVNTSKESLQEQLECAAQRLPEGSSREKVDILSLALISKEYLCATVTCDEALVPILENDNKWVIDKDFIGITPLFDPDNAKVE